MPTKTTIDSQELSKFAQYAKHWWDPQGPLKTLHAINPARIKFILKNISSFNQLRILDVGCGGGILCESMAKLDAIVTGIDAEPHAIQTASTHAQLQDLNIQYICQPVEELYTESFDIITCMEMLEHANDPSLVIENCARLLKTNGYLFLSTLNRTLKSYTLAILIAEYVLGELPRQTHDYSQFIRPSELAGCVRAAGFEVIDLSGLGYNPFTGVSQLQQNTDVNYLLACRKL